MNLTTKYMGLELKNPLIVGACNLSADIDNLKKIEQAGAAAVVYKSLFEEQIQLETLEFDEALQEHNERYSEMTTIFPKMEHAGPKEHLLNLKKAKKALNIPLIASLNCVYDNTWVDYAKEIEKTGVDALELNFYALPKDFQQDAKKVVEEQVYLIKDIKDELSIPVSVKLSPYYTNMLSVISNMDKAGANAFVLFNRLFQPEIDIEKEIHHFPWNLSSSNDRRLPLRFAGLLYGEIKGDVCCNSGIFTGADAIQVMLAGATAFQIVSTLYKNGIDQITKILSEIEEWMQRKNYTTLEQFVGKLSNKNMKDPYAYKRAQYVDILWNSATIFEKFGAV